MSDKLERQCKPYFSVIMPYGCDPNYDNKQRVIGEIANLHDLTPRFPKFNHDRLFNLEYTIETYKNAIFILADLSFERPSCYYELGVAEALGIKIYVVASKGTIIHQTKNRDDIQFYENMDQFNQIIERILYAIKDR
jgi:hypothetical protein